MALMKLRDDLTVFAFRAAKRVAQQPLNSDSYLTGDASLGLRCSPSNTPVNPRYFRSSPCSRALCLSRCDAPDFHHGAAGAYNCCFGGRSLALLGR